MGKKQISPHLPPLEKFWKNPLVPPSWKISFRRPWLQVSGNTLQQVEKFKHLGVVFTSDGRQSKEIYTRIGKAYTGLRELYRSVFTKRVFPKTAKLSVYKSIFVPILTYDHESWVMTKIILSQVQSVEMGFLGRVHGVTLHVEVGSCEIRKTLNVEHNASRVLDSTGHFWW